MFFRLQLTTYGIGALATVVACMLVFQGAQSAETEEPSACSAGFAEQPALKQHLEQEDILMGHYDLEALVDHGMTIFEARFNTCDGQGRPTVTGTGQLRAPGQPRFIRTSGPDANSCAGCHVKRGAIMGHRNDCVAQL